MFFVPVEPDATFVEVVLVETTLPVAELVPVLRLDVTALEAVLVLRLVVLLMLEPPLREEPPENTLSEPV